MTTELKERGYQIIPGVLTTKECDLLIARFSSADVIRSRAGARHLMGVPDVANLTRDRRLLDIAFEALGTQCIAFRATLFEKTTEANWLIFWHQDTTLPLVEHFDAPGWGPWSIKAGVHYAHAPSWALSRVIALRVHLDQSGPKNGPLRVLPGTHRLGVLTDEAVQRLSQESSAVECVVPKGGVLVMYPLIVHSSPKLSSPVPRRVLHVEYTESRILGERIQLAVA